jgi:hypothetical protein
MDRKEAKRSGEHKGAGYKWVIIIYNHFEVQIDSTFKPGADLKIVIFYGCQ